MGHVANVVGGVEEINRYYGDADQVYYPNSADYQKKAVQFLNEHAFIVPGMHLNKDVLGRISPEGAADSVLNAQKQLLASLVNERRIKRMAEISERNDAESYPPMALLNDLRAGIFDELQSGAAVSLYRRNLQRSMVEHLASFLKTPPEDSDLPALARQQLLLIDGRLKDIEEAPSSMRGAHFQDLIARIERALNLDED
jgi:hypothetical protein